MTHWSESVVVTGRACSDTCTYLTLLIPSYYSCNKSYGQAEILIPNICFKLFSNCEGGEGGSARTAQLVRNTKDVPTNKAVLKACILL